MNILVTGSEGFIGSRLLEYLKHRGQRAHGLDLKRGDNLLACELPPVDVVYHLAAQTSVEDSWKNPMNDSLNLPMTVRIADFYKHSKIIFTQSAAAIEHSSPYGFSKWASGEYLKQFHTNTTILTLPNVFGGGKGVVDIFKNKKKVTIYGDGMQIRDFVHVDDIIKALYLAQKWPLGEFSCGSGIGTRIIDLASHKTIIWADERKEIRESVLPNTTPDWKPIINVIDYLHES